MIIHDITPWLKVWPTYISAIVPAAPTRVHKLFGYQHITQTANKQLHTRAALSYGWVFPKFYCWYIYCRWDHFNQKFIEH